MDMSTSWQKVYPARCELSYTDASFIIHCDGGRRGSTCFSSAWVLEAHWTTDGRVTKQTLAMARVHYSTAVPSFVAELMTVDSCAAFIWNFITQLR
eukprot:7193609-Pyramimonas_sp.AAC.1